MKKKLIIMFLVCSVALLAGSAISFGKPSLTIRMLGIDQAFSQAIAKITPEYEKEHGVKVEFDLIGWAQLRDKEILEMSGRKGAYNLVNPCVEWLPYFAANEFVIGLDEYVNKYGTDLSFIFANDLEAHAYNGVQYGMPVQADTRCLWYRTDILAAKGMSGPPQDWDEWFTMAQKLTGTFEGHEVYGVSWNFQRGIWTGLNWFPMLGAAGGIFFDEQNIPHMDSTESIEAVSFVRKCFESGITPPDLMAWDTSRSLPALKQGLIATGVMWTGAGTTIKDDPAYANLGADFIPLRTKDTKRTFTGALGGWSLAIPANAPNKEETYQYLAWLVRPKIALEIAKVGGDCPAQLWIADVLEDQDWTLPLVAKVLKQARPIYHYPEGPEICEVASEYLHKTISGAQPIEEAMKEGNEKIYQIMVKAGHIK